ncbi:zf-HC2 domain-containing protein [Streptomyces sp. NPDC047000]|uniref:anti-sigma factor family protein n=1 Tax=Streptomyces sp. NPDC047000 TaxID=3155474 RepID=UPI0033DF6997
MTASRPKSAASRLAEAHLGDRLSALVDGELGHDTRERVLAHVATCPKCKAEVDAQRRLKNVFAEVAPPPPSESFLARLQGLPGGGDQNGDGDTSPFGAGPAGRGLFGTGGPGGSGGARRPEPFSFGYVPLGPAARRDTAVSAPQPSAPDRGFRVHPVTRPDADRPASRGLRFAVVAAGAVSLAAVALGGVTGGVPADRSADARGGTGSGSNVTPARTAGTAATTPETQRRRQSGPLLAQGGSEGPLLGQGTAASTSVSAPLLPGGSAPAAGQGIRTLTTPVMAGAVLMSPLIRPLGTTAPVALTTWPAAPEVTAPGVLAAPVPDGTPGPSGTAR